MGTLDYRGLAVLDAVAASGSFEKAALALGISQSAVSQRIKALEDAAGRLLVVRGTPSAPTGLGQRLVLHYRHVMLMEAALDIDLGRTPSLPSLTVALDGDSLAGWFGAALPALLSPPRCQLSLQLADSGAALALVREGAVFACVAAQGEAGGTDPANGTTASALGVQRYLCVATPVFAGHWFGDGFTAAAVALAPAVDSERQLLSRFLVQQFGAVGVFPQHCLPVASAQAGCILAGVAYGLLPEAQAEEGLAAGRLVTLGPDSGYELSLAWHAWNIDTPFTRALSEHIIATARRHLRQP
ncbi:MAG: ArgP/LysG family DNA-binding transcriptional regulator [Pseudomonadota bacterium]